MYSKRFQRRRRRRNLLVAAALLAIFTVAGFLLAPPILKKQLTQRLSAELGRRVTVEKVRLNPYELSLTLEQFAIHEPGGTGRFLGWDRLYVNFDALSSVRQEWVFSEIALEGFRASVAIQADATYNFSDILARLTAPAKAGPADASAGSRPVRIGALKVSGAQVAFSDASQARPFATTLGPLTFSLTEFRTTGQAGAPYRFEASTEAGERLAWSGTIQAEPLRSRGTFSVQDLVLPKYSPYYADRIQADVLTGTLSARGGYEFDLSAGQRVLRLKEGALQIRGVKVVERANQEPAFEMTDVAVSGVEADAFALKAAIASVVFTGGHVHVRREQDGAINLLTMLRPATQPAIAVPAPGGVPAVRPDVTIAELALKDFRVDATDRGAAQPVQLALSDLQLGLKNVTLAEGASIPLELAFAAAPKGTVKLEGALTLSPVQADLKVHVADLDLPAVSPYLEQFVNARLTQGALSATLETRATIPDTGTPAITISGDVQLDRFGLVDRTQSEDVAGFDSVQVRGLRASTGAELAVAAEEINVVAPFIRVVVNADGMLNLASLVRTAEPVTPAVSSPISVKLEPPSARTSTGAAGPAGPGIEIGRITIRDGDTWFTDRSIQPHVSVAVSGFGGEIAGLSSTQPGKGRIDIKALIGGSSPITIAGRFEPLAARRALDIQVDCRNVDLVPLSPYSAKFAGYDLARGKLLVDVKARLDGQRLDATSKITLNQLTFGNAVQSPAATKLPVRLGVALLKDADGNIVLEVPVQGNLDDPSFGVGPVVMGFVANLLTKAATSPFNLLGAVLGVGGDELAFQEFTAGSAELLPTEMKKLQAMTRALAQRPALTVALDGGYDAAADAYALKRVKLAAQVREAIWAKQRQAEPNLPPAAESAISPEESIAMIKQLYDAQFPPGTRFGAPVPPPPPPIGPPSAPEGIFRRLVRAITGKDRQEQRAIEQENARRAAEYAKAVEAAIATGVPFEDMSARLADVITVGEQDLRELAAARARRVRDYFLSVGGIAADRLLLANEPGTTAGAKGARVLLSLQ